MAFTEALNEIESAPRRADGNEMAYRSLSASALASVALGALSGAIFYAGSDDLFSALMLAPLPLAGLIFALRSWRQIKASGGHLSGERFALIGGAFSLLCGLGGMSYAGYVWSTECPPGHERISFMDFCPTEADLRANRPVPDKILALDGKHVFLKGYIRPDSTAVRENIQRFLLVRDNNACCYGELSAVKYYDQVGVAVNKNVKIDLRLGVLRVGGVLHVHPENVGQGLQSLVFTFDASSAQ